MRRREKRTKEQNVVAIERSKRKFGDYDGSKDRAEKSIIEPRKERRR